jgi:hypothetical protein
MGGQRDAFFHFEKFYAGKTEPEPLGFEAAFSDGRYSITSKA